MARGIGGDDGPSLFMFVAVVLIWGKIAGWFERATDKVGAVLEIGHNSGGPAQSETTEEIDQYRSEWKSWTTPWSSLKHRRAYYQAIANKIWAHFKDKSGYLSNIDEDYLIGLCQNLTGPELRAVAICFGVKDKNNFFGMTSWTGHILHLWETILTDTTLGGNDLTTMRKIWSKSGLWL